MGDARPVLMQLIDERLLTPGAKKLYVSYYRKRVYADLLADGSIRFKDTIYISPVPCALQMKRTLNPSLKTDAGWSTMYSAATGESLKDIKDRLNIRKRGPNSRTVNKEKKLQAMAAAAAAGASAVGTSHAANGSTKGSSSTTGGGPLASGYDSNTSSRGPTLATRCSVCRRDASSAFTTCSACKNRSHLTCAEPPLQEAPTSSWFCGDCLGNQANSILEFLRQTHRVISQRHPPKSHHCDTSDDANVTTSPSRSVPEASADDTEDSINVEPSPSCMDTDSVSVKTADISTSDIEKPQESTETAGQSIAPVFLPRQNTPERFLALLESLIQAVESTSERADIITNSTGATLVHLAKSQLVGLLERGIASVDASRQALQTLENQVTDPTTVVGNTSPHTGVSDVEELIRLFDLRHEVLRSRDHFRKTSDALTKRSESRLRTAEAELMELEESRVTEARAVEKIANTIENLSNELKGCQERIRLHHVLLESMSQRRKRIRTQNVVHRFVPAYRQCAKQMLSSSDRLLVTVLLDKLREVAGLLNEWQTMEEHFETMSSKLHDRLEAISVKVEGPSEVDDENRVPSPLPLFARVKIPPSRRLLERQLANYNANLKAIQIRRQNMRQTLKVTLRIATEEHLGEDVIETAQILLGKCGQDPPPAEPVKIDDEEPVVEKDPEMGHEEEENDEVIDESHKRQLVSDSEQDSKRRRLGDEPNTAQQLDPMNSNNHDVIKREASSNAQSSPTRSTTADVITIDQSSPQESASLVEPSLGDQNPELPVSPRAGPDHRVGDSDVVSSPIHRVQEQEPSTVSELSVPPSVEIKQEMVDAATRNDNEVETRTPTIRSESFSSSLDEEPQVSSPGRDREEQISSSWNSGMHSVLNDGDHTGRTPDKSQPHQQSTPIPHLTTSEITPKSVEDQPTRQDMQASTLSQLHQQQHLQQHQLELRRDQQHQQQQQQNMQQQHQQQQQKQQQQQQQQRLQQQHREQQHLQQLQSQQLLQQQQQRQQQLQLPQTVASASTQMQEHGFHSSTIPRYSQPVQTQSSTRAVGHDHQRQSDQHQGKQQQEYPSPVTSLPMQLSPLRHSPFTNALNGPTPGFQQTASGGSGDMLQRYRSQQPAAETQRTFQSSGMGQRAAPAHPLYRDSTSKAKAQSSNIPTPQDLFGGPTQSSHADDSTSLHQQQQLQQQRTQAAAAMLRSQPQHAHAYQAPQLSQPPQQQSQQPPSSQQHLLHHHHLNPVGAMGHQHTGHGMVPSGTMASHFSDPITSSAMRSVSSFLGSADARSSGHAGYYGDNAQTSGAHHHMLHGGAHDVFGSHGLGTAGAGQQGQQQQQQPPQMHLFQTEVQPPQQRPNPADFHAHFGTRLYRDPNESHDMDPAPDMSEW